jgi:hypothetical protein
MWPLRPNGSYEYVKPPLLPHKAIFHNRAVLTAHHNFFFPFPSQKRTASVHVGQSSTRARNHQLRLRQLRLLRLELRVVRRR